MTRLFLIRHGEPRSAWGGDDDDPGLSEAGAAQAQATALTLAKEGPLCIVTSPMKRCRETAAPYEAARSAAALVEPRVSEVPTPAGITDRRSWLQSNFPWRGGEARPWSDVDPHLHQWRSDLLNYVRSINADAAIFSHFIAINVIAGAALERDDTIVCKPDYASITELSLQSGVLRLVKHGAEMQAGEVR